MQPPIFGPLLKIVLRWLFLTPSEGAHTSVFAAASPLVYAERAKYERAWLVPPGTELGALVREREGRLADEREHDLGLVALVDVLHDALPVPDLRRGERVHGVPQVGHRRLAHLLLVRDDSMRREDLQAHGQ